MDGAIALVATGPKFTFKTTVGGLATDVGEGRSVALHLGCDENGIRRWACRFDNGGHIIKFGLSDEAMTALVDMHTLLSNPNGQTDEWVSVGDGK